MTDVVKLTQDLIRCPSITPIDAGALAVIEHALAPLGFTYHRVAFGEDSQRVENLFAHRPGTSKHIGFAGHTDVVPVGDLNGWTYNPFGGDLDHNMLFGRGAVDMKGAIAAFITAVGHIIAANQAVPTISFMITGDEEGPAINGTEKLLSWVKDKGLLPDYCIVGEPTSERMIGDTLKVGRRGSINICITERGTQGHVAYPDEADNPIPRMVAFLAMLENYTFDQGYQDFQPSRLVMTSVDVGNKPTNVIPAEISAHFNIRFNPHHTGHTLTAWVRSQAAQYFKNYTCASAISGEAFYCPDQDFISVIRAAIEEETGRPCVSKTTGGTSDARFISKYCPVVEIGLCHRLAHHVNERVPLEDLESLVQVYKSILSRF